MSEDGWILLDIARPRAGTQVLVCAGGDPFLCWFHTKERFGNQGITHWHLLPEPPEPAASKRDEAIREVVEAAISRSPSLTVKFLSGEALRLIKQILAEHETQAGS